MENKVKISKETIIETTLQLVEMNEGVSNVTLREIAKKMGCAHTNLYNYYTSLDQILWETMAEALKQLINYSMKNLEAESNSERAYFMLLSNFIDFSLEHPGLYKLIWSYDLNGNPSPEVMNTIIEARQEFDKEIARGSKSKLSGQDFKFISDLIFNYLYGEISMWINKRSFIKSKVELKTKIMKNIMHIFKYVKKISNQRRIT